MGIKFSNKSNAVRGFRENFADLAASMDNATIRTDFIDSNQDGTYSINLDAVADYQQEKLGVVTHNAIQGVPMLRRSVSRGVVHKARALYANLPAGTARKDAIATAVASGIAFYTARTQYQAWRKAA